MRYLIIVDVVGYGDKSIAIYSWNSSEHVLVGIKFTRYEEFISFTNRSVCSVY